MRSRKQCEPLSILRGLSSRWLTQTLALLSISWLLSFAGLRAQEGQPSPAGEEQKPTEPPKPLDWPLEKVKKEVDDLVKKASTYQREEFPALEKEWRRRFTRQLGDYPHPYTVKALQSLATTAQEPTIRAAAMEALGDMKFDAKKVATFLASRIAKEWKEPEVLIALAGAVGELGDHSQYEKLEELFDHSDDGVLCAAIAMFGTLKEIRALPTLQQLFQINAPRDTQGVSVRVDTGAPGNKDQMAAARKGKSMQRRARVVRREGAELALKKALEQITGVKFEAPSELNKWMNEHEAELVKKGMKR
ncbi:MAG: HEAT repeat domain-containing protein [Planctomycetota bacterium]